MIITRSKLKDVTGVDYYDGSVLHSRFAYKFFKKQVHPTGNILAFTAPMEVTSNLVDLEDSLNKDYIYSDSAINFIMELPGVNIFGGVVFQRLFNAQVGSLLCGKYLNTDGYVDGDDIKVVVDGNEGNKDVKKASVSIALETNNAVLIHTGININAGEKAPKFAYSTNLTEDQIKEFSEEVINMFHHMTYDIFVATTKVAV
jgi:hypothetical protein